MGVEDQKASLKRYALNRALVEPMSAEDRAQLVLGCAMPTGAQKAMTEAEIKSLIGAVAEGMRAHAAMVDESR